MRDDLVGRRIGFDAERGVGQKSDPGGRRLLQFTVRAAMHVILPDREIALLRQRVRNRARIIAAERLKLLRRQPDDDLVLDGDDLEQVHLGLLRPCALYREGEKRDRGALDEIAARKHAVVLWC